MFDLVREIQPITILKKLALRKIYPKNLHRIGSSSQHFLQILKLTKQTSSDKRSRHT